jgi:hypothetical protein
LVDAFESGQKSVLHGVVGVRFVPENTLSQEQQPAAVSASACFKCLAVTGLHPR